ncbi:MAG TPA: HIT domain-containing protein [Candidatus Paceibacterota bacterium]
MQKRKILFVCTGNVFRSMSAEYALRKYIEDNNITDLEVASAGTRGGTHQGVDSAVLEALRSHGIDASAHVSRPVTKEMLEESDVVIAMADYHVTQMDAELGFKEPVLFNRIAKGESTSVPDINDVIPDYQTNRKAVEDHTHKTVSYICENIPALYESLDQRYTIFSDFITGRKKINRGNDVSMLYDGEHSAAFMSIAIPEHEDAHILVVPKKRYMHLHNIPAHVRSDVSETIARIGRALQGHYGGYNVLLNNGSDAGQYVFHTHFHIIPRKESDDIKIEVWKDKAYSPEEFKDYNLHIKNLIENAS